MCRGFLCKNITLNNKNFKYSVYVPLSYKDDIESPAILFLNGKGECGTDGLQQISVGLGPAIMKNADKWPFIVIFPQKQDPEDNWEDEIGMVDAIINKTLEEYKIDENRFYLTGISQGGHGTWAISAIHKDKFAAIAPVCGWGDEEMAKSAANYPVWCFHGEDDEIVPVVASHKMIDLIEKFNGNFKLSIYKGVNHNSWDMAYQNENLADWFLSHKKS